MGCGSGMVGPRVEDETGKRKVFCVKFQREMMGLDEVPFDNHPLGQRIYDRGVGRDLNADALPRLFRLPHGEGDCRSPGGGGPPGFSSFRLPHGEADCRRAGALW